MTIANQFDHRLKQKYVIYKQQMSQSAYKILKQMEEVNALTKWYNIISQSLLIILH